MSGLSQITATVAALRGCSSSNQSRLFSGPPATPVDVAAGVAPCLTRLAPQGREVQAVPSRTAPASIITYASVMKPAPAAILIAILACVALYHGIGALRRGESRVAVQRFAFSGAMASAIVLMLWATGRF